MSTIALTALRGRHHTAELTVNPQGITVRARVAASAARRLRGMLGRDDEALLIVPCSSVHGIGMRRSLTVAYLDRTGKVLAVKPLRPGRVHWPVPGAHAVLEVSDEAAQRWALGAAEHIEVRLP